MCALLWRNFRILGLWSQNEFEDERVDSKWKSQAAIEKLHVGIMATGVVLP